MLVGQLSGQTFADAMRGGLLRNAAPFTGIQLIMFHFLYNIKYLSGARLAVRGAEDVLTLKG